MDAEIETRRRARNARRLILCIEAKGGRFHLGIDSQSVLLTGLWVPCRLRRRMAALWPEIVNLLLACAAEQTQEPAGAADSKLLDWPMARNMVQ